MATQTFNSDQWHVEQVRVRYADTDRMGVVYHANYLIFFEACRSSLIRKIYKSYLNIEADGYLLVVIETGLSFRRSSGYEDILDIYGKVASFSQTRIKFEYKAVNQKTGELVVEGFTEHCFTNQDGKPCRMPEDLHSILELREMQ